MSRNGVGIYVPPIGQPVVSGTSISSAVHNALIADIGAELTRSIASDGQTTPTANLPMGGYTHTGLGAGSGAADSATIGMTETLKNKTLDGSNDISSASGQVVGFSNRIINGEMLVATRGTSGAAGGYALDRILVGNSGVTAAWAQSYSTLPSGESVAVLQLAGAAGNTGVNISQRVSAANSRDLAGKTVAVSYWVLQTSVASMSVQSSMGYATTTTDDFLSITPIGTSTATAVGNSVFTKITHIFSVPSSATKGISVTALSNIPAISGGQAIYFTQFQLSVVNATSQIAPPFERRSYEETLTLCLPYCRAVSCGMLLNAASAGMLLGAYHSFTPPMRAVPTTGANSATNTNCSATVIDDLLATSFRYSSTSSLLGTVIFKYTGILSAEL